MLGRLPSNEPSVGRLIKREPAMFWMALGFCFVCWASLGPRNSPTHTPSTLHLATASLCQDPWISSASGTWCSTSCRALPAPALITGSLGRGHWSIRTGISSDVETRHGVVTSWLVHHHCATCVMCARRLGAHHCPWHSSEPGPLVLPRVLPFKELKCHVTSTNAISNKTHLMSGSNPQSADQKSKVSTLRPRR